MQAEGSAEAWCCPWMVIAQQCMSFIPAEVHMYPAECGEAGTAKFTSKYSTNLTDFAPSGP